MKKIITGIAVLLLMALAFTACQKNNTGPDNKTTESQLTPQQIQQVALMKETSLAIGKTIKNNEARNYLVTLVRVKNDNSEAISMAALLGDEAHITKYEKVLLEKGFKQRHKSALDKSFFAKEFLNIIYNNPGKYPILSRNIPHEKSSASTIDELNALRKELASQNLEIYLPYRQDFDWDKITNVTVTWHPLVRDTWSVGELISVGNLKSASAQPVNHIDENYVSTEPTVLVRPIDPDDYTMIDSGDNGNGGSGSGTGGNTSTTRWVTSNNNFYNITKDDNLKVLLPKIKLTKNYRAWLSGSSKINIYRISGTVTPHNDGSFTFGVGTYQLLTEEAFSRHDVKHGIWHSVNITWDDDWKISENTEQFVLVSKQGFLYQSVTLDIKGNVKIGWDKKKNIPTFNPTMSLGFEFKPKKDRLKLRYNNQLSRRGELTSVVGDEGAGVFNDNGVDYTIKTADALQYYFKYRWTHVSN